MSSSIRLSLEDYKKLVNGKFRSFTCTLVGIGSTTMVQCAIQKMGKIPRSFINTHVKSVMKPGLMLFITKINQGLKMKQTINQALSNDENLVTANIILDRNSLISDEDKRSFAEGYFSQFDTISYKIFSILGVVQVCAFASEFKKMLDHGNIAGVDIIDNAA